MNYDFLFAIIFYAVIFLYYLTHKEKFEVQGKIFVLYKTSLGIKLMDKIAKLSPKFFRLLGVLSITIGFAGMIIIFYILIRGTIDLIFVPEAVPVIAPILPGVAIPGLPTLSFWHWIVSILIVATIHEFSHGVFARAHNIKVKSSGFAFLGPILAAFVEPDEKELPKKKKFAQLSVFAAGPFSNIVTGFIFFFIAGFLLTPLAFSMLDIKGVSISGVEENFPAAASGLKENDIILEINNISIDTTINFSEALKDLKPGDKVNIKTETNEFNLVAVEHPENSTKGYLGLIVSGMKVEVKESVTSKYGTFVPSAILWLSRLFEWLFLISFGIALANLLPLGPVDGGRMALTGISLFIKDAKKQYKVWFILTLVCLLLIVINLLPFLQKLFVFIFNSFIALI